MAYTALGGFPPQQLPFSKKGKKFRKACVDFGDNHSLMHYHVTRKSVFSMKINYDLLNGKVHMADMKMLLNPYNIDASFIPDNIQHYPIINSKLEVLRGEESKRLFDFRAVVTNPTAISEMEEEKNALVNEALQRLLADDSQSEEEFYQELEKMADYFTYEYQDKREVRGNLLLNHYMKEYEIPVTFNNGFVDAYTVGEEAYQCDIIGGEPTIEKIDPRKMRVIKSGSSNKIEDADMIVLEDYWNPGRIIDTYWDQLTKKDIETIENAPDSLGNSAYTDSMDNLDARYGFIPNITTDWTAGDAVLDPLALFDDNYDTTMLPYDLNGNVRVLRVYWKSRRQIKKIKSYNPETGEEEFNFYPETYHCDPLKGEEEQTFWVNEAWEGTKIGKDIYVNMRPRPVQYNRLSNPSRCHFGIVGSIYNINGDEPFSLVDIMKPYAYLYDIIHDKLNKLVAKNKGRIVRMDFSKVPKGWDVDKWLYYIDVNGIAAEDSFKEGNGLAQGKLAGAMNNASNGAIDASLGNEIQQYVNFLEWITTKIGELAGISKQREGQISNRETVGGVERATLQSSLITERLFFLHDSVKKRTLECFLETAKIALKGRKKKFDYILDDGSRQLIEIDGDEFAECDFGIVVDNSQGTMELNQKLETIAQAALQNQLLDFSTIMKLYTVKSTAEKQRIVENNERKKKDELMRQQQQEMQMQQMQLQQQQQIAQAQLEQQQKQHQEDNEVKILIAQINAEAEKERMAIINKDAYEDKTLEREKLSEEARQFNETLALNRKKQSDDVKLKEKELALKKTKK